MKFLYVLRHGESQPSNYEGDYHRELTVYGKNQVQFLAEKMRNKNLPVELVLCSAAKRTKQTCIYILQELAIPKVTFLDELYECDLMTLLQELRKVENAVDHLMLVGHNPGVSALVSYLTGEFFLSMNPGDLVVLSLEIGEWNFLAQDIAIISDNLR
ncbi:SixA phosphatase family protein [Mongoliitalea daihaiensis]|uniref:SixA phosphatase family protein n=1 Tax=Mongoliitalea daihaiensis TaxID=2782006 RepID=UPI001F3F102D|nr:histidine phosphatase family protein [Mongoliitalea daihaiensis]UJP64271.1 histidine phosphatase family protein [Mongoliitalea daihaiensis]